MNTRLRNILKITEGNSFNYLTKDDLTYLLSVTEADASEEPQIEMIEDALDFTEQVAKDIMVPRTELVAIPATATVSEAIELLGKKVLPAIPFMVKILTIL